MGQNCSCDKYYDDLKNDQFKFKYQNLSFKYFLKHNYSFNGSFMTYFDFQQKQRYLLQIKSQKRIEQKYKFYNKNILNIVFQNKDENYHYTYLQWHQQNLLDQFLIRQQLNKSFSLKEINIILVQITNILYQFQNKNVYHGDIQLKNIILNEQGQIFMFNIQEISDYTKDITYFVQQNPYYLVNYSPEQLALKESIQHKYQIPEYDYFQSQIFQFGITLLQCLLLDQISDIYNLIDNTIDNGRLQTYLLQIDKKFDYQLAYLIRNMLQYDPEKRITLNQMIKQIDVIKEDKIEMFKIQKKNKNIPQQKIEIVKESKFRKEFIIKEIKITNNETNDLLKQL